MLAAVVTSVGGGAAVDHALVGEDRIDLANRLYSERCGWRLAGSGEVGELEEFPPGMGPAEGFTDGPAGACRRVEAGEAAVGIGLEDSGIAGQVPLGMLAAAVARIVEEDGRRALGEGPVVADIGP